MIAVEGCVRMEDKNLRNYLRGDASVETLILAAKGVLLGDEQCKRRNNHEGWCTDECYREESGAEYKERIGEERAERVVEKKMHGRFFREVGSVSNGSMFDWVSIFHSNIL